MDFARPTAPIPYERKKAKQLLAEAGYPIGRGLTHTPPLLTTLGDTALRLKRMLHAPLLPVRYRSPATWPEPMR
jgi:ABC-type transport system substrate-binding protein